jgi:hypothetical protein
MPKILLFCFLKLSIVVQPTIAASLAIAATLVAGSAEASVMKSFGKANKLFGRGQFNAASKILLKNIKKYPGHQPSLLLMARIYYRKGNVRKAARYFRKVPPGMVSGVSAYEYGISMFETKRYNKAIKALRRVGNKAKQKYLAKFYLGAAYMRNRQWQKAVTNFQRAKKLPNQLRAARRKLLRTARRRLNAERRGQLTRSTYVIVPTPPPVYQPAPTGAPDPSAPKTPATPAPPPPPPPPPSEKFTNSITPSVTFNRTSSNSQNHGFSESESESQSTTFAISDKARYDMKPRANGGQGHFQVGFSFAQANTNSTGSDVKYVAVPNEPGIFTEEKTAKDGTTAKKTTWSVAPEVGFPFTESIDVTGKYSVSESMVDDDSETVTGSQGPSGNMGISPGSFDLNIGFSMTDSTALGETVSSSTTFKGDISKSLDNDISVSANASQTTYELPVGYPNPAGKTAMGASISKPFGDYNLSASGSQTSYTLGQGALYVTGAQSVTLFSGSVSTSFDFGGSVSGSYTSKTLADYTKPVTRENVDAGEDGSKPSVVVVAQGTEQIINGTFKLSPFDYVYGLMSYSQTQRGFTGYNDPTMQAFFEASESDLSTKFVIEIGISKTF